MNKNHATPSALAVTEGGEEPLSLPRLLGAHMPTSGGLAASLKNGKAIGCTAVQVFTSSPRQWSSPPLDIKEVEAFHQAHEETGIDFLIAHDSYLINLAAPDPDILERSRNAFRHELDRAEQLGLLWVVTHMGAHLGIGEEAAIDRLVESLQKILEETDALGYRVGIALETTAGQGTGLGWRFEQLGEIIQKVGPHPRIGVCMDTCHIFVAGYDIRTPESLEATLQEFDKLVGIPHLKVLHVNDAKKGLGSRVDRHEHIGMGEIGDEAFRRILTDPRLLAVPALIETPDPDTMHAVNLRRLQRLVCGLPPEPVHSN